jgi:hypothetical protein
MEEQDFKNILMFIDVSVSRGVVRGDELDIVAMIRRKVVDAIGPQPETVPAPTQAVN